MMSVSDRTVKNATWLADAYAKGQITYHLLKGNPLAIITIMGVSITVSEILKMLDAIYRATCTFDGSIFRKKVREDYDAWLYFSEAERASFGIHDENNNTKKPDGFKKRIYFYDWSAFFKVEQHMIKNKNLAQFVNVAHFEDRAKLFFTYRPGEMALLQLAICNLTKEQLNSLKLMFIVIGVLTPTP